MNRFMEVVQSILASLRSAVRWTSKTVWDGTKWTSQMVAEHVVEPSLTFANRALDVSQDYAVAGLKAAGKVALAAPGVAQRGLNAGGDAVVRGVWTGTKFAGRAALAAPSIAQRGLNAGGDAVVRGLWNGTKATGGLAVRAADAVLGLPGAVLGSIGGRGRGGGSDGQQAAQTAQKTQADVSEKDVAAKKAQKVAQDVGLIQRVAAFKVRGHDINVKFGDVVPARTMNWLKALSVEECDILAKADSRILGAWISGAGGPVPGVRSPSQTEGGQKRPVRAPQPQTPAPTYSQPEAAVLNKVAERIARRHAGIKAANDKDFDGYPIHV